MKKAVVQTILDNQPSELDLDAFLEQVLLREKLEAGEADFAEGRTVDHGEAKKRLSQWLD